MSSYEPASPAHAVPTALPTPAAHHERRRETRYPIRQPIFLRTDGIPIGRAWLLDLSASGCCVHAEGVDLRIGQCLSLHRGAGLAFLTSGHGAVVRWTHADMAGLQFERAIPSSDTLWQGLIATSGGSYSGESPALPLEPDEARPDS
ncbi:PilZ domain-containing protein [Novosphingobium mangrovi (ex Hu et al. 2023)]|uniref:PilZ domain-containing protein n=1 Tax=Novosphingobium mangrovi (ex Hu et al. 2023) TaxID=2930094 RepID=A0ABT0A8U3_9SPHN|nr:PilZ domain-containing protein [Novosphingobium mangrovi (ex Hu et al. 2023)]MCJ1959591.1 PilZ domain-containing protein [Novosphingobium mangrovi (ex Hu et al. 2023)]